MVNLFNPIGAVIGDGQGPATIIGDEQPVRLRINDVVRTEGQNGQSTAVFTVSLSIPSGQTVSVVAAPADDSATGGANCGGNVDF